MNIYFLVEGKRTEMKVYPKWLNILLPELKLIKQAHLAEKNNFYIFSGEGYPHIIKEHLINAIDDCNKVKKYNYLVLCLDCEEFTVKERKDEIINHLNNNKKKLHNTELIIIIQNRCFETWFLGNRKIFKRNPQSSILKEYIKYYDVSLNDPELMGNYESSYNHAQFHEDYLREIFSERKICYTKKNPGDVVKETYLKELIERNKDTNHIPTFKNFIDFCDKVKKEIK